MIRADNGIKHNLGTIACFAMSIAAAAVICLAGCGKEKPSEAAQATPTAQAASPSDKVPDHPSPATVPAEEKGMIEAVNEIKGIQKMFLIIDGTWDPSNAMWENPHHNVWRARFPGIWAAKYHYLGDESRPFFFVLYKGISIETRAHPLSDADRLNGIEWKGDVVFCYHLKREYKDEWRKGLVWQDWELERNEGLGTEFMSVSLEKKNGEWSGSPHGSGYHAPKLSEIPPNGLPPGNVPAEEGT